MKQFHGARKIPAFFQATLLLGCLALSACGDATPTSAVRTTPPFQAVAQVTPFSPVAFEQLTTAAATTPSITTASPTTKRATTVAPPITLATTATLPGNIRNNWLRGLPCKAPCWENIKPGKTTPHDAIEILKNIPEFTDPKTINIGANSYDLHGTDSATGEPSVIFNLFAFHSKPEPAHVEIIKPEVDPYKLKDAFATYGEPSNAIVVYAFQEGTQPQPYSVYLIYMSQGLILSNNIQGDEPTLTPETTFNGVYFFIPGQQGFNLVEGQGNIHSEVMVKWEGYKDFKYYCRAGDASSGVRKCT